MWGVLALSVLLDAQVQVVSMTAFYHLRLVCQLHPLLEDKDVTTITCFVANEFDISICEADF